jgi:hypothetical protein
MEEIAKKVPLFEPAGVGEPAATAGRPLPINLELWLHRAKVHTRKYEFAQAEKLLDKVRARARAYTIGKRPLIDYVVDTGS